MHGDGDLGSDLGQGRVQVRELDRGRSASRHHGHVTAPDQVHLPSLEGIAHIAEVHDVQAIGLEPVHRVVLGLHLVQQTLFGRDGPEPNAAPLVAHAWYMCHGHDIGAGEHGGVGMRRVIVGAPYHQARALGDSVEAGLDGGVWIGDDAEAVDFQAEASMRIPLDFHDDLELAGELGAAC